VTLYREADRMSDYSRNHKRLIWLALDQKGYWLISAILSLLSAGAIILLMFGLSTAVNAVFMQQQPLSMIQPTLYLLAGAILFRGVLFWLSEIVSQGAASQIKKQLRIRLFRHIQDLGPAWTGRQSSGELSSTAVEGVEKLDDYFARFLPAAIHMLIVPAVLALFVIWMDWLSGLILIITGPLIPVFMSLIGMQAESQSKKQWTTLQKMSSHFLDTVQGLRTLKLFNRTGYKQQEVELTSDLFRRTTMGILKVAFLSGFVLELFASIATALVAVEIGIRLIEGHIGFQLGLFVLLLAPEYYLPFRMFGARHHAGMEGTEAAGRIFEILGTPISVNTTDDQKVPVPEAPYSIHYDRVSYTYPGSTKRVLDSCSFRLDPGCTTALVGRSGSGKTTITRLLSQQIAPEEGAIQINGISLRRLDESEWLRHIAVVNQGVWLFDDTVWANLVIARPGTSFDSVVEAAKAAEAHEFITGLPQGYETRLGEHATRLSGGERQRLAMARAFLRNASLVILDEPSSALDPESEHLIATAMQRLMKGRAVLIVAHRLSTVQRAEKILVMDRGRIIDEGTHQKLLESNPLYQKMVTMYHNTP